MLIVKMVQMKTRQFAIKELATLKPNSAVKMAVAYPSFGCVISIMIAVSKILKALKTIP
jgi:hypothetical protein